LKTEAADGKIGITDVAVKQQLLRLTQSIPSPKAEPFKKHLVELPCGNQPLCKTQNPKSIMLSGLFVISGERGIRTPGTSRFNGFQDRRDRPLCHLSNITAFDNGCKSRGNFETTKQRMHFFGKKTTFFQ
jgi:hypothetical protein